MLSKLCLATAAILGCAAVANGLYMLLAPHQWYLTVPGVPMSGPFNQHFIRDIALVFLIVGAAFLCGIVTACERAFLWSAASLWLVCHALLHLWQVAAGISPASAIRTDFPAVTLPALLGLLISVWAIDRPHRTDRQMSKTA